MSASQIHESRFSRYLKALVSNYTAFLINVGTYAVTVPLLLQWLGSEQYGVWLMFLQLTSLAIFGTMWTAAPIAREAASCYVNCNERKTRQVFQTALAYCTACGIGVVVFALLSYQVFLQFFQVPSGLWIDATRALILLSLYTAGSMQLNLLYSMLTGFQQMHIANFLLGIPASLGTILGIGAIFLGLGLSGLAAGYVVGVVVLYSIGWWATRQINGVTFGFDHFDHNLLRDLHRSGSSYFAYAIAYVLLHSDIFLVGILLGPTAAAVYGIAYKLTDYLVQLIWKIPDSLFPTIAELDIREGSKSLRSLHSFSGKFTIAVAFLLAIPLALYGHTGLSLWLGPAHAAPQNVFIAFGIIMVSQVIVHSSLAISYGTNRMSAIGRIALAEGAIKVILALLLTPQVGMVGIAVSTMLAQLSLTTWYVPLSACKLTGDTLWSYFSRTVLSALPAALVGSALGALTLLLTSDGWVQVCIGAPLSMAAYAAMYAHSCLRSDERQWLANKFQSIPGWQKLAATRREAWKTRG
jgi:O-antigen/teichoic acid export membrane protein